MEENKDTNQTPDSAPQNAGSVDEANNAASIVEQTTTTAVDTDAMEVDQVMPAVAQVQQESSAMATPAQDAPAEVPNAPEATQNETQPAALGTILNEASNSTPATLSTTATSESTKDDAMEDVSESSLPTEMPPPPIQISIPTLTNEDAMQDDEPASAQTTVFTEPPTPNTVDSTAAVHTSTEEKQKDVSADNDAKSTDESAAAKRKRKINRKPRVRKSIKELRVEILEAEYALDQTIEQDKRCPFPCPVRIRTDTFVLSFGRIYPLEKNDEEHGKMSDAQFLEYQKKFVRTKKSELVHPYPLGYTIQTQLIKGHTVIMRVEKDDQGPVFALYDNNGGKYTGTAATTPITKWLRTIQKTYNRSGSESFGFDIDVVQNMIKALPNAAALMTTALSKKRKRSTISPKAMKAESAAEKPKKKRRVSKKEDKDEKKSTKDKSEKKRKSSVSKKKADKDDKESSKKKKSTSKKKDTKDDKEKTTKRKKSTSKKKDTKEDAKAVKKESKKKKTSTKKKDTEEDASRKRKRNRVALVNQTTQDSPKEDSAASKTEAQKVVVKDTGKVTAATSDEQTEPDAVNGTPKQQTSDVPSSPLPQSTMPDVPAVMSTSQEQIEQSATPAAITSQNDTTESSTPAPRSIPDQQQ